MRRALSVFAIVLCLLVVLLLFVLTSAPVRRFALNRVTSLLASQQIELQTDELRYNLFKLSFDFRNIRVRSERMPDAPVFATIGRAQIDLSLSQLLRGKYVVKSGTAEGVDIHYFVDANGNDNLPRPPSDPNEPSKPLDYLIQNLTAPNAKVRYENQAQQIDVVLPLSSVTVNGSQLTDRHKIRFDSRNGQLHVRGRSAVLDRLAGALDLGSDDLSIDYLQADAAGSHLVLSGAVREFDAPQLDVALKGTIDGPRAATLFDVTDPVAGHVTLDVTAKGPASTPAIDAHVSGRDLQFRSIADAQLDARVGYDVAAQRADIRSAQLDAPWGSLNASGQIALDSEHASTVKAAVTHVDAATLMRGLELPYVAATRVDAQIDAQWPGLEYLRANGEGRATLTATTSRVAPSAIPVAGRVTFRGNGGKIVANLQHVVAAGANVAGQVTIDDRRRISGALSGNVADIAGTAAAAETFLARPRGSLLPAPVSGPVAIRATVSGTLDAPSANANVDAPALAVGDARDVALSAALAYSPTALTITRADVNWQQAHANAAGTVGLTGDRRLNLTLAAEQMDVQTLLRAAGQPDLPVSGTLVARGSVNGSIARPVAALNVQGSALIAYGETFGALNADAMLAGRDVTVSRLTLDKPQPEGDGRITATGAYNLDRRSYSLNVQSDNVTLTNLTLPDGERVRGRVTLTADGSGTVEAPAGRAKATIDGLEIDRGLSSDAADATSTARLGRVTIDATAKGKQADIVATAPDFTLDANATVGLARPWPATISVRAAELDLAKLPIELSPPLTGQLRATVDAKGDLAEPERGEATANIEHFAGSWNQQPFTITSPSRLRYANERLDIERLQVTARDSSLVVSGQLPLTDRAGQGDIAVEAHANLATLAQYLPPDVNVTGDGAVTLTGSLHGTLKAIDPDLVLTVENGVILSPEIEPGLSNVRLRAHVVNGAADLEQLAANWGSATLDASGRVPLDVLPTLPVEIPRTGGPATLKASVRGLDPAAIPGAPPGLGGHLALDADVSAARADLAALTGRITFPTLDVSINGLTFAQQEPSSISIGNGAATIDRLALSGTGGSLTAHGTVGLTGDRVLDAAVDGSLQVAALSTFTNAVRADGTATLKLAAQGTVSAPDVRGSVDLADLSAVSDAYNIAAENVTAHVNLDGTRVELTSLRGDVNGGSVTGSGTVTLGSGGVSDVDLQLAAKGVAYDAPLEVRSVSDANLRISRGGDDFLVSGKITIDEAGQTADINFDQGLFAAASARPTLDLTEARNPFLERVHFNIDVNTRTPMLVENNLAHAEVDADLRVVGTPYETGLTGRLTLLEGAEITLNERKYEAERGVITFLDERRIAPSFDLLLDTTASNYDITIAVTGEPGKTETTLTSDPTLPEPDIMALLVTGRTLDEMRGEEYEVAREQVLSYLAGRVASRLGRGLERATGLSEVRVEPQLIANETDPSARLTVGESITDELKLVYSTNLTDSSDQVWVAEYDVTRRFQARGVRQSDNSYRFDFKHDVRFGGQKSPHRESRHRPKLASLTIATNSGVEEPEIRDRFKIKEGDDYDFFSVRHGVDRIEQYYRDTGYLQSRVRVQREVDDNQASVKLDIVRGPRVDLRFEGATPPGKVQEEVRTQWNRGVFDKQRADDGAATLRQWLMRDDHLQPKVTYDITEAGDDRREVVFHIEPGPRYTKVTLAFEGAAGVNPDQLRSIIKQQKLERQLFTDPTVVTTLLERYYREEGYLSAKIDPPRYDFTGTSARVALPVQEGPRYQVRKVIATGTSAMSSDDLVIQLPLVSGDPFMPVAAENSLDRIREIYWRRGYNDMRSEYRLAIDRIAGQVDVTFAVTEGRQSVIAEITTEGSEKTSEHLVREQVELAPGEPLNLSILARSRRNLYDTGAFSIVDITREDLEGDAPATATTPDGDQPGQDENQKPVRVNVNVREVEPFQLKYGASYDTERGIGGILDISNHNSLGKARVIGLQGRYDREVRDARLYISQPSLRYWPLKTTGSIYIREELNPPTQLTDPFDISRRGASLQQEMKLRDSFLWSYGYRYERATTLEPALGPGVTQTQTVSPLTSTISRETRDEVLDASRGSFLSQAFSYSPAWLGSDVPYISYFGQYFHYFPLQAPQRKPFTNEIIRPRLVFATAVRLGLAHGFGGDNVPAGERFYAGGSTTLRGFEQNAVGPIGFNNIPAGGNALLILNNELRAPLIRLLDGVLFVDVGNVYPHVSDFSFTDLRESAGVGLRVRTPWFLIRGDYGFVLDPRPGESRRRFYFSIGQAF